MWYIIFLRGWVFVFFFAFCSCHASHLIASCTLHRHCFLKNFHPLVVAASSVSRLTFSLINRTALFSLFSELIKPLAFVDRSETNRVSRVPLVWPPNLFRQLAAPLARIRNFPEPKRSVITVESGSSPNIYKTSPFSLLDSLSLFFSTVQFKSEGPNSP